MGIQLTKEKLLVEYSNSPIIRGIIAAIGTTNPMVGAASSMLDIVLTHNASKIQERRSHVLFSNLLMQIEKSDMTKIDSSFFKTEEWNDILISALNKTSRTRIDEKIIIYAKILKGVIEAPTSITHAESYLEAISELSFNELLVAKLIYKYQGAHSLNPENENELQFCRRTGWNDVIKYCAEKNLDYSFTLQRIAKTGLIKEITGAYLGYLGEHYVVTTTFKNLMSFINENFTESETTEE